MPTAVGAAAPVVPHRLELFHELPLRAADRSSGERTRQEDSLTRNLPLGSESSWRTEILAWLRACMVVRANVRTAGAFVSPRFAVDDRMTTGPSSSSSSDPSSCTPRFCGAVCGGSLHPRGCLVSQATNPSV